jgi:hypothetical protein
MSLDRAGYDDDDAQRLMDDVVADISDDEIDRVTD